MLSCWVRPSGNLVRPSGSLARPSENLASCSRKFNYKLVEEPLRGNQVVLRINSHGWSPRTSACLTSVSELISKCSHGTCGPELERKETLKGQHKKPLKCQLMSIIHLLKIINDTKNYKLHQHLWDGHPKGLKGKVWWEHKWPLSHWGAVEEVAVQWVGEILKTRLVCWKLW